MFYLRTKTKKISPRFTNPFLLMLGVKRCVFRIIFAGRFQILVLGFVIALILYKLFIYQKQTGYLGTTPENGVDPFEFWRNVDGQITRSSLYGPDFRWDRVVRRLQESKIEQAWLFSPHERNYEDIPSDLGSTHKWFLRLEGDQYAIFKPFWDSDGEKEFWYLGFESPAAEVISFHVDRLLGFRAVPYSAWREITVAQEILPVASHSLRKIFYTNGDELCFQDKCYFCEEVETTCTRKKLLPGSIVYFVKNLSSPGEQLLDYKLKGLFRDREHDVCREVYTRAAYDFRRANDICNLAVLDYLTYHFDSKLYHHRLKNTTIFIDRGRAYSRSDLDAPMDQLLKLITCSDNRRKTWTALKKLLNQFTVLERLVQRLNTHRTYFALPHVSATERRANYLVARLKYN